MIDERHSTLFPGPLQAWRTELRAIRKVRGVWKEYH